MARPAGAPPGTRERREDGTEAAAAFAYRPVRLPPFAGFHHAGFDLPRHWPALRSHLASASPFYSTEAHRKVYRIELEGTPVYLKATEESLATRILGSTARTYFRNYRELLQAGIGTAQVLFWLDRGFPLKTRSLIGTRELTGFRSLPDLPPLPVPAGKRALLEALAGVTARLHRMGWYFSLDGRNLFARGEPGGPFEIALLDLEHMRRGHGGRIPERRRTRNLERFRKTLGRLPGAEESDFSLFLELYESHAN